MAERTGLLWLLRHWYCRTAHRDLWVFDFFADEPWVCVRCGLTHPRHWWSVGQ